MNRSPECADLGAYVLGGLDAGETDRYEEHLLGCRQCLGEIDSLQSVRDLLLPLVGEPLEALGGELGATGRPDDQLLDGLLRDVARDRHRRTWRTAGVLTAAAALLVALPFAVLGGRPGHPVAGSMPGPTPSPAAMLMMTGEQHSAADPGTGVSGEVGLEDKAWGTHVALQLSGVSGPLTCSLVAVSTSGERETVTNWAVPATGYGVPGHPDPLLIHGGTSLTHRRLDHFEVQTSDGRRLLSIPV